MSNLRIVFRTDANQIIGTGHFMRCLTLADELQHHDVEIGFVARDLPQHFQEMLSTHGMTYFALPNTDEMQALDELPHAQWLQTSQSHDAQQTLTALGVGQWDWLVVDHYALDHRFETSLRAVAKRIMVIDDLADRVHDCDVLLDQNFYQDQEQRYIRKVPSHARLLLGPRFALLRPEFKKMHQQMRPRSGKVRNILVSFGGVDALNLTTKTLELLIDLKLGAEVNVVIGQQNPHKSEIHQICVKHHFNCHIQTNQMTALMAQADLAIGAGGTTIWEKCCMGLPSICIPVADNQYQQLDDLRKNGLVFSQTSDMDSVEFLRSTLCSLISHPELLNKQSQLGFALVDGEGVEKVATVIKRNRLSMRLAESRDISNIFQWRNHYLVRNNSTNSREISWEDHCQWFEKRLSKNGDPILIGEVNDKPVGVVRFDIGRNDAEVSIYLVPESGFKGWGSYLLEEAENWLRHNHPEVATLHAQVLPHNRPSQKLFARLNYNLCVNGEQFEFLKTMEVCV